MNRAFYKIFRNYQEISVRYDEQYRAIWCYYNPTQRPCFSLTVLQEARQIQQSIIDYFKTRTTDANSPIRYLIMASQVPGIFNLGGDLCLFAELIKDKDRQQLAEYATQCIDICFLNAVNLHLPLTTISLVEGAALGGGFESALSSNILIATENAEMGFPEIRFNLFPGMGAFSLLARLLDITTTETIIAGGKTYSARELFDMGIVNHLAAIDNGPESVVKFIQQHQRSSNGYRALQQVRQRFHPINYQELVDVAEIWVDAALRLKERDLRMIDRLVNAQEAKVARQEKSSLIRTIQDRRLVAENNTFPLIDWSGRQITSDRRNNPDRRQLD